MANEDDKKLEGQEPTEVDEETQDESVATGTESTETAEEGDQADVEETKSETTFEKRFTQFKGDDPEEYLKHLEDGYANSSKEALRLKKQLEDLRAEKLSAIANADSDDKKEEQQKPQSITDIWASQEMKRRHAEQFAQFAKEHPEVNDDDELFNHLDKETGKYMEYVFQREDRVPELDESLRWAWDIIVPKDRQGSREEKVASATKNAGASSKSKSVSKDATKPLFSDKAIETAKRFDPSLRDKSRAEIEEILAKYK